MKFRDHSNQSLSSFKQLLPEALESFNVFSNFSVDDKFKMWIKKIETSYNMHCKIKFKNGSTKRLTSPWTTDYSKTLI